MYRPLDRPHDDPYGPLSGYSSYPPWGEPAQSRLTESIYPILELCIDAYEASRDCRFQGPVEFEHHIQSTQRLLLEGADAKASDDTTGGSCLHFAAGSGSEKLCELLLCADARSRARDRRLRTPLWWAIEGNHKEVCRILLDRDWRVAGIASIDQMLPMHEAAFLGSTEIVRMLLPFYTRCCSSWPVKAKQEVRVGVDARGFAIRSPLHVAASQGHLEICQLLVKGHADPLKKCAHGKTALHYAAESGFACSRLELCDFLVSCGSMALTIRDASGRTPVEVAAKNACLIPELYHILQHPKLTNRQEVCQCRKVRRRPQSAIDARRRLGSHHVGLGSRRSFSHTDLQM